MQVVLIHVDVARTWPLDWVAQALRFSGDCLLERELFDADPSRQLVLRVGAVNRVSKEPAMVVAGDRRNAR